METRIDVITVQGQVKENTPTQRIYLEDFVPGETHESPPHEISEEEAGKLKATLAADKDITYYFNAKDGLKILVASLKFNTQGLEII